MNKGALIAARLLRRQKERKERMGESSFDSSAIGDMAFLLLIFFIVTSSFLLRQGIFLSLPSQSSRSVAMKQAEVIEVVPRDRGFLVQGKVQTRTQYGELLAKHKEAYPKGALIIRMPEELPYHRLVDTLSVAREQGMTRISLKDKEGR